VSQPFEYGKDIYIVKILERVEPKPLEFDQVKDHIRSELEARQHEQLDAKVASRLLEEARATIYSQVIQNMLEPERERSTP
jgi:parvulin-like peptidyl-prolyl isomerase